MDEITRREIIAGTAAVAAAAAAPATPALAQAKPRDNVVNLECGFITRTIDGTTCRLRAYNGTIPGPPMIIEPGQRLIVNLKNALPRYTYDDKAWTGDHNVPHRLGSTNLHTHGLDVIPHLFQPLGTSDPQAPMIDIEPGQTYQYVFQIPHNHPPGLDWYHPHHHGSTVVQAASGMAGGIVVKGRIDEVPEIKAARDIPLVLQDLGLFPADPGLDPKELGLPPGTDISNFWTYLPKQNAIWQTFAGNVTIYDPSLPPGQQNVVQPNLKGGFTTGDYALRYYLVNGEAFFKEVHNQANPTSPSPTQLSPPTIPMQPGEVVRFRMLTGNSDNYMPIAVQGHEMHLLALDGVNFPKVRTLPVVPTDPAATNEGQIQLAPANRAEFMIKASMTPGAYNIVQLQQTQQFLVSAYKIIATIVVDGPPKPMALPSALPIPTREYPLIKPSEIKNTRTVFFSGNFPGTKNPYVGIDFLLNGQLYDETRVDMVVNVGDAEQWTLIVGDSHHGGTEGHPFHIHVNSFEVISVNGSLLEPGTIKDTVWIPQNSQVVIRTRYKEWVGKSVFHCHILPHEDTGMMQNFLIKRAKDPLPLAVLEGQVRSAPPSATPAAMPAGATPGHGMPAHRR